MEGVDWLNGGRCGMKPFPIWDGIMGLICCWNKSKGASVLLVGHKVETAVVVEDVVSVGVEG